MRIALSVVLSLLAAGVQAHESLVPHHHPHAHSMLPDLGTFGIGAVVLAAALIVYYKLRRG